MSKTYRKTRRTYSVMQKLKHLDEQASSGLNMATYADKINIPARTLQKWRKNKSNLRSIERKYLKNKKVGSGDKPILDPSVEIQILDWFLSVRSIGIPITDELIISRAKFVANEMNLKTNCKFSKGWLQKFKNRYHIVQRKGGSKIVRKNDCEISVLMDFVGLVNEKINSNEYFSIINIDETGLYYDPTINFTLDIKGTERVEIKTTGREKQRVTIILGIDLLNNIQMKPFIIFKGKTTRCLQDIPLMESYELSYQEKAWCSDYQFIKFLSSLPKDKKILLLYDNFRGHKTEDVTKFLKTHLPLVDILLLPPNTTSIMQPLDIGINKSVKSHIRSKYTDWLIKNIDKTKGLPQLEKKDRNKLLVRWISESWSSITNVMIKNSFNYCGYGVPDGVEPKWKQFMQERQLRK